MEKRSLFTISLLLLAALACNMPGNNSTPFPTPIPPLAETPGTVLESSPASPTTESITFPTADPETAPTQSSPTDEHALNPAPGIPISFGKVSLALPPGLATSAAGAEIPAAAGSDLPPWELTPGNTEIALQGYALPEKFHQPMIYIYPAQEYAALSSTAKDNQTLLNQILTTFNVIELPTIPFFNAGPILASQILGVNFQNGQGLRYLTQFAQYSAPVNNDQLFYHFQGLTSDGKYYIIAILPITAPGLAETSDPAAPLPPDGVSVPSYDAPSEEWYTYYTTITQKLDNLPANAFTPTLDQLDALISSIFIEP